MELIADANILFSFFDSKSFVRRLIINSSVYGLKLYTPDFCMEELENNKAKLLGISKLEEFNFTLSLSSIDSFVSTMPESLYSNFLPEANKLLPGHPKDAPYLALALKLKCSLWSKERRLKKQGKVKVFNTSDLLNELGLPK